MASGTEMLTSHMSQNAATAVANVLLVADVADDGETLTAHGFDVGDGGVHGAGQLRMRLAGLGEQHHVGAELRRSEADGEADPSAAAGHDHGAIG
jgi:hypothetical protein